MYRFLTGHSYRDWDEVVGKCETVAYYQSLKKKTQITAECGL